MSRPEDTLAADIHYNDTEARKYTTSSRIQNVQAAMTRRALELLDLPGPSFILDVGCGSGLSGEILTRSGTTIRTRRKTNDLGQVVGDEEGDQEEEDVGDEEYDDDDDDDSDSTTSEIGNGPHVWVGMDISPSMLDVALQRDVEGDLLLADMGQGVPFRAGSFDAAISISAVQWLCNAESSDTSPQGRLTRFFNGLYASLRRGGRAVCQFYPKNDTQRAMITQAAVRAGFGAGILEDDPGTKNMKVYLVLTVGGSATGAAGDITGVVSNMDDVDILDDRARGQKERKTKIKKGSKAWITKKKEQMERKGKIVKASSKYTGRKRRVAF
ncbi:18S rRNA (guanine1575-N7)-methyltransferase [Sporothrix eucalyptigena]|uniref:18S rRNA (Guanine1575-N7)-methyltransferase n=1 Tax=Sporothrix eucalyptigena TaxID=1812306 RepID=A0ABP0C399_9PEZI